MGHDPQPRHKPPTGDRGRDSACSCLSFPRWRGRAQSCHHSPPRHSPRHCHRPLSQPSRTDELPFPSPPRWGSTLIRYGFGIKEQSPSPMLWGETEARRHPARPCWEQGLHVPISKGPPQPPCGCWDRDRWHKGVPKSPGMLLPRRSRISSQGDGGDTAEWGPCGVPPARLEGTRQDPVGCRQPGRTLWGATSLTGGDTAWQDPAGCHWSGCRGHAPRS